MWKFQCLLLVMKRSYICYYMICMAVPRNKIVALKEFMWKKVGICVCSERKIDETFPDQGYRVHRYKLCRSCRNKHGGGVIFISMKIFLVKLWALKKSPMIAKWFWLRFPWKIENHSALASINRHYKM